MAQFQLVIGRCHWFCAILELLGGVTIWMSSFPHQSNRIEQYAKLETRSPKSHVKDRNAACANGFYQAMR
jgi:hypothetical protein